MTEDSPKARAESQTDAAFAHSNFQDPRPDFRDRLRFLREEQPKAFSAALAYYEETLVPSVAGGEDPVTGWIAYGQQLGELTAPGKTFTIDPSGRARPYRGSNPGDHLVIHLPNDTAAAALPLAVPRALTPAQHANYELLIGGARRLA
jgi:hypothetical protein